MRTGMGKSAQWDLIDFNMPDGTLAFGHDYDYYFWHNNQLVLTIVKERF